MRILCTIILVLVAGLSPFYLGSNRPVVWVANGMLASLCLVCVVGLVAAKGSRYPALKLSSIWFPLTCLSIAVSIAALQLVPINSSGLVHPTWGLAAEALNKQLQASLTLNADETVWAILRYLSAAAIFLSAFILARDRQAAGWLLGGLLTCAALIGLYGIIRLIFGIDSILWFDEPTFNKLSASFVGSNNAATFFGICAVVCIALAMSRLRQLQQQDSGRSSWAHFDFLLREMGGRFGVHIVLAVFFLACVLMTTSRGGLLSTLGGLVVVITLHAARRSKRASHRTGGLTVLASVLAVLALVAITFEVAGGKFLDRVATHGMESELRVQTYVQTMKAIADNAWLGTGAGTFQDVFPLYRLDSPADHLVWDKAHNDYLELLLGTGVPVGIIVLAGFVALFVRVVRGGLRRRQDEAFAIAAAGTMMVAGLHSFLDFSMQIQAITFYFAVFTGVGAAQSLSSRSA